MSNRFRVSYENAIKNLILNVFPPEDNIEQQEDSDSAKKNGKKVEGTEMEVEKDDNKLEKEGNLNDPLSGGAAPTTTNQDSKIKAPVCIGEGCKKRSQFECVHKMCFLCCYYARKLDFRDCGVHHQQTVEREREDKYIEEGLSKKQKKIKLPYFHEDRFTDAGQTVVIWCLKDFCANKKWSEECFNQELRKERQKLSLEKRSLFRAGQNTKSVSVNKKSRAGDMKSLRRRKAQARYQEIRKKWDNLILHGEK